MLPMMLLLLLAQDPPLVVDQVEVTEVAPPRPEEKKPKKGKVDSSGVTLVRGMDGWGQVCPIDSHHAWTASHVTTERGLLGPDRVRPLVFTSTGDSQGTVLEIYSDARRDLSMVEAIVGEFGHFYAVAEDAPRKGDKLVLVGIDDDFLPKRVETVVRSVIAGSIIYNSTPGFGSSGSCLLNAAGLLVGINTFGKQGPGGEFIRGGGWSLYGIWSDIPDRFKVTVTDDDAPVKPVDVPKPPCSPAPKEAEPPSDGASLPRS